MGELSRVNQSEVVTELVMTWAGADAAGTEQLSAEVNIPTDGSDGGVYLIAVTNPAVSEVKVTPQFFEDFAAPAGDKWVNLCDEVTVAVSINKAILVQGLVGKKMRLRATATAGGGGGAGFSAQARIRKVG